MKRIRRRTRTIGTGGVIAVLLWWVKPVKDHEKFVWVVAVLFGVMAVVPFGLLWALNPDDNYEPLSAVCGALAALLIAIIQVAKILSPTDSQARREQATDVSEPEIEDGAERPESPPFVVPCKQVDDLVGHHELLEKVKQRLLADGSQPQIVLRGLPGVGKTELMIHLARAEGVKEHFSDGVLWAGLGPDPDIPRILGEWAYELDIPSEEMNKNTEKWQRKSAVQDAIGERRMLLLIDDVWDSDDAEYFIFSETETPNCAYLITTRLRAVAAELADAESSNEPVEELNESDSLELLKQHAGDMVTEDHQREVKELVKAIGGLPLVLRLIGKRLKVEASYRDPERLRRALKDMRQVQERLDLPLEKEQRERLQGLPRGVAASLHAAILISERGLDPKVKRTLRELSIFPPKPNTFTKEEASSVSSLSSTEEMLYTLVDRGLLEYDPEVGRYALQRTIADYARLDLSDEDAEQLHRKAADYYADQLTNYEEDQDVTAYPSWYRYEDPEWQRLKTGWLYHLSHTQDRNKARIDFARVYFDAFWWWGGYLDFPLCEKLLSEWEQTQTLSENDREWLGLLREFHGSYLTGYESLLQEWEQAEKSGGDGEWLRLLRELLRGDRKWLRLLREFHDADPIEYKEKGKADWDQVRKALNDLRKLMSLGGKVEDLANDLRHLRAITAIFLAHAHRYQGAYDDADEYYEEALKLFKEADDPDDYWNIPWVWHEQSDLYLERARGDEAMLDKALEKCQDALRLAEPKGVGFEIKARSYRVQADIHWRRGDPDKAFDNYAYATFYAYTYHGSQGNGKPDRYTIAFHREMVGRTLVRLRTLWDEGKRDETVEFSARLHDFWKLYWNKVDEQRVSLEEVRKWWTEGQLKDLAAYLFPSEPREEDLENHDGYVKDVNGVYKEMVEQVGGVYEDA